MMKYIEENHWVMELKQKIGGGKRVPRRFSKQRRFRKRHCILLITGLVICGSY